MRVLLCDFCHARLVMRGDVSPQGNGVTGYSNGVCAGCEKNTTVHNVIVLDTQDFSFLKLVEKSDE